MAEIIDIFNANLEPMGSMDRKEAHTKGMWHITFHCWIVTKSNDQSILFQVRSNEMINFPNMLDVSAAGHIESGETVEDGIREVSEELGIDVDFNNLYPLGYRVEVADQANGQMNREYQAVYLYEVKIPLQDFKPQIEEVSGLLWMKIQDGIELFDNKKDRIEMNGIVFNKELNLWEEKTRIVSIDDFLPRIQNYYLTSCIMAERLLENKFPLSIS